MIISTRESKAVRETVIRLGVSQISGASRTSVGGYSQATVLIKPEWLSLR